MKEIKRVNDFSEGDFKCIKCKEEMTLWYNGGELDEIECCNITYRTEHQEIHLVIYEN